MLHLNKIEPLGRIFLEAIDYGLPLLGFASGGIGEIADCLELRDLMVKSNDSEWEHKLLHNCVTLPNNWSAELYSLCYQNLVQYFSPRTYTNSIEQIFNNE